MQLKPGTKLQGGKIEILRTLGQGGFGITYEAEQVLLGRKYALKEFFMKDCCERDEATSQVTVVTGSQRNLVEKFRGKFIREARMMADMDHPNIVRVLDVFEENGTAYYVMENLPGGSLSDKVKREGPLPEAMAEKYIRQVADALAYVHSLNTVHLDVKPLNILLNAKGEAVLIDFGISKHFDDAGEQTSSTPVGISIGYAPLEQGRNGDVAQFKPSTDIYALGATLYYLLTGAVPPEASIVNEDGLDRPKGVSDRMWKVIEQAMQPRRKDRPQTVDAFLALLDGKGGHISEKTIIVPKPKPEPGPAPKPKNPTAKKRTKTRLWTVLGGIAVVAIIAAIALGGRKVESSAPIEQPSNVSSYVPEWVDMGLSVKWAMCNVGATKPEDYGSYLAWSEVEQNNSAFIWRMPTEAEWTELINECKWERTDCGGKEGYKVTGKNGNSIFLPAAGFRSGSRLIKSGSCGFYWSSTPYDTNRAWRMSFVFGGVVTGVEGRSYGLSVRPVADKD